MLRSYSYYGLVAPKMLNNEPCSLYNLDGYAAAAGYLQIFNKATTPVNGDVPLKSVTVSAAGPLPSVAYANGLSLDDGLWVAMSSTRVNYTAVATAYDIWGEVESSMSVHESVIQEDLLSAGTTSVLNVNPWVTADGPKKLFRAVVTNNSGSAAYVMLFSTDFVSPGAVPIRQWPIADGATLDLDFGPDGVIPRSTTSAGVTTVGCNIMSSTTTGAYTPTGAFFDMTAYYK